jgi:hypothetical protein
MLGSIQHGQSILFPVRIEEMIPEDAEGRMIDLFVDWSRLKELAFIVNTHRRGKALLIIFAGL